VFLKADVGRLIISGASRAIITQLGPSAGAPSPNAVVIADILDVFPSTSPIASGSWVLRNSPQTNLDPTIKEPIGAQQTLDATDDAFRVADVGKFVKIFGGLIQITSFTNAKQVKGQILSILTLSDMADPPAAPAGSWTLEVPSWSTSKGFPRSIEFHEGRLTFGGTTFQPTTWWMSRSDDFNNFAIGPLADNALEYTIASRQVNVIRWMASFGILLIGDAVNEHAAFGSGTDDPLGGDIIPRVKSQSAKGSKPVQPLVLSEAILFIQRAGKKVFTIRFDFPTDRFKPQELTVLAEHITTPALSQHTPAFASEPNSQLFFIRSDGVLLACTYDIDEGVIAWSRYTTDGLFESVAVIPHPTGDRDQIWVVVNRTINGATKRYIEFFDDVPSEFSSRAWQSLYTDSAFIYDSTATIKRTSADCLNWILKSSASV